MAKNIRLGRNNYTCYIGENKSEDIFKELNEDIENVKFALYKDFLSIFVISHFKFQSEILSIHRLLSNPTKFIDENGNTYKGTLYFITDLINVLEELNFKNPYYYSDVDKKWVLLSETAYPIIFIKKINIIKNIIEKNIVIEKEKLLDDFIAEKKKYESKKEQYYLQDLNPNINFYQDINLAGQRFKVFDYRTYIISNVDVFLEQAKKEPNNLNDILFSFYGLYSSGKSTTLMYLNFKYKTKSIYINLKILKRTFPNKRFWDILFKDLLYLFIKAHNSDGNEYLDFISNFYEVNKDQKLISQILISLFEKIKNMDCIIFLDQFNNRIENNIGTTLNTYFKGLKMSQIKMRIIICSSINDKELKPIHTSNILDTNYSNNPFNFKYLEGYYQEENYQFINIKNKNIIKNKFNNMTLYCQLIDNYNDNSINFINNTKSHIKKKIEEFFEIENIKNCIIEFEKIRNKINEIIEYDEAKDLVNYMPYKYFILSCQKNEDFEKKYYMIEYYFPLIKDIWEDIIIEKTVDLFSGEIKNIDGNVIGSMLELNFKIYCINNKKKLKFDGIIEVEQIINMDKIISSELNDYESNNIFFIQSRENAKHYDFAYYEGSTKRFCLIQVKKGYTSNKVDKNTVLVDYNNIKTNLNITFNIFAEQVYLCYIGLLNNSLIENIKNNKRDNNVLSLLSLYNFCSNNKIKIIFFHIITKNFYVFDKKKKEFQKCNLDFFDNNECVSFYPTFKRNDYVDLIELDEEKNYIEQLITQGIIEINNYALKLIDIKNIMEKISTEYKIKDIFIKGNSMKISNLKKYILVIGFIIKNNYYKAKYIFYENNYYEAEKFQYIYKGKEIKDEVFKDIKLFVFIYIKNIYILDNNQTIEFDILL